MTSTTQSALRESHERTRPSFGSFLQIFSRLSLAYRIYRERRALLALSDNTLKDIGLSRADAYREAERPLWDLPDCR